MAPPSSLLKILPTGSRRASSGAPLRRWPLVATVVLAGLTSLAGVAGCRTKAPVADDAAPATSAASGTSGAGAVAGGKPFGFVAAEASRSSSAIPTEAVHGDDLDRRRAAARAHARIQGDAALVPLRELLAEQASATQAEHVKIGDKIESIVDIVGMVGETVHQIATVALQPKPPLFSALPTRPTNAVATGTDRPMQASPQPAVTGAAMLPS